MSAGLLSAAIFAALLGYAHARKRGLFSAAKALLTGKAPPAIVEIDTQEGKDLLHKDLLERMNDPSQNPYGNEDWLCHFFPMMTSQPISRTFAAQHSGRNIGLMVAFEVRPKEIFLNGLRTDPSVRRGGVATTLLRGLDANLAAAGMSHVRMGVASWNTPMLTLAERKLKLKGCSFCGIRCKAYAPEAEGLPVRQATAADRAALLQLAHSDEMLSISGALVQCTPGQFCKASAEYFDGILEGGHCYVVENAATGALRAAAILAPNPYQPQPSLNFVAGHDDDAIVTVMSALRRFAPKPADVQEGNGSGGSIPVQILGYLPTESTAIRLVAAGKVPGWERHTTTFEKVYGWEAGKLGK